MAQAVADHLRSPKSPSSSSSSTSSWRSFYQSSLFQRNAGSKISLLLLLIAALIWANHLFSLKTWFIPPISTIGLPRCSFEPSTIRRIILLWNNNTLNQDTFSFKGSCGFPRSYCEITTDRSLVNNASVIIMQDDTWDKILPHCRHEDQVWVYQNLRAVSRSMKPRDFYDGKRHVEFNWTLSFRHNSDIVYTFYNSSYHLAKKVPGKPVHLAPVVWAEETCDSNNHRILYLKELIRHVRVDIFGSCMNNTKEIFVSGHKYAYPERSLHEIYPFYKFSLAFEDTDCEDYITEQLWTNLQVGTVPIVMGAPNIDSYIPHPHSVIKVSDFKSPYLLANYLLHLTLNETAYMEYHAWRQLPDSELNPAFLRVVKSSPPLCRVCSMLMEKPAHKHIPDTRVWDMTDFCRQIL